MTDHRRERPDPAANLTRRQHRTYVVLAYTLPFGSGIVTAVGTIVAPTLAVAYAQAESLADARGGVAPDVALRVRRASACRPALLLIALARDGAAAPPDRP